MTTEDKVLTPFVIGGIILFVAFCAIILRTVKRKMFSPFIIAGLILFVAFCVVIVGTHHYHTKHGDIALKEKFVSYRCGKNKDNNNLNPRY